MITLIRGDDAVRDVTVTSGSAPVDLTEAESIRFTAKGQIADEDDAAVLAKSLDDGIAVDESTTNVAHITFAAEDTRDLVAPRILIWDIEIVDAAGLTRTVAAGYLRLVADVTREAPAES